MMTFFTITPGDIASTTAYSGSLVSDFMPLLVVLLGILVGLLIIKVIAGLVR